MPWSFVLSFAVASIAHNSTLPFGIAQMTTTGLALITALLLVFVFKRDTAFERGFPK